MTIIIKLTATEKRELGGYKGLKECSVPGTLPIKVSIQESYGNLNREYAMGEPLPPCVQFLEALKAHREAAAKDRAETEVPLDFAAAAAAIIGEYATAGVMRGGSGGAGGPGLAPPGE